MRSRNEFFLVLTLIALGVAMRFLPHPANVAPIAALALFSGVYLKKWYAMAIPLAAMIVSDAFLGFHDIIAFTWGCFLAIGALGWWVRNRKNVKTVIAASLTGSIFFYIVTNFAVWAWTPLYEKDGAGLLLSYTMALPFFRNTLLGDLFFTGVFFGLYELVAIAVRRRATMPVAIRHD